MLTTKKYLQCFTKFEEIRKKCFGQELIPGYETDINDFVKLIKKVGIPIFICKNSYFVLPCTRFHKKTRFCFGSFKRTG